MGSQMNLEWDRQRMVVTKAGTLMEQRQERLRKQLRKEQDDANKYLNQEQKAQQKHVHCITTHFSSTVTFLSFMIQIFCNCFSYRIFCLIFILCDVCRKCYRQMNFFLVIILT